MTAFQDAKILTVASCSFVRDAHRSNLVVSGSYGGRYNAFNAAMWGVRGVIMNDAGIGKDNAGICGLDYLDQIDLAAAPPMRRHATSATAAICSSTASSAASIAPPPASVACRARASDTAPS
jgi:hypothetical protein